MKRILLYAAICYFCILLVAWIHQLPTATATGLVTTATNPLSPYLIYIYIAFTIISGFVIGYVVLRAHKQGKLAEMKTKAKSVFRTSFSILMIVAVSQAIYLFYHLITYFLPSSLLGIGIGVLGGIGIFIIGMNLYLLYPGKDFKYLNRVGVFVAVIGALLLGSFIPPFYAFLFLGVMAVYDFIAVFITKHMQMLVRMFAPVGGGKVITRAPSQAAIRNSPFVYPAFIFEGDMHYIARRMEGLTSCLNCKMLGYGEPVRKDGILEFECKYCHRKIEGKENELPQNYTVLYKGDDMEVVKLNEHYQAEANIAKKTSLLGLGDLLLGGLPVASIIIYTQSFELGSLLAIGASLGIVANMVVAKKLKRPLPALPLLFVFELIFYGIGMVI